MLGRISAGDLTRYPERAPVERIVAEHLGLAPEQVVLTNGVDEAIHVLFETFLDAGDELLLPVPTYTMYEVYASATDARVVTVQAADDLQFPFERLLACDHAERRRSSPLRIPTALRVRVATREQIVELARARSARGGAGGRSVFSFSRRDRDRPDWHDAEPDCGADVFESVRTGGFAAWAAGRASRTDALDSARAFALQREFARAGVPAAGA